MEIRMGLRIFVQLCVQPDNEIAVPVRVGNVLISQQAVPRAFKIVLNDRTAVGLRDFLPDLPEMIKGPGQFPVDDLRGVGDFGKLTDVPGGGVDTDDVGAEFLQGGIGEHDVLPVTSVFGFIKSGFDPLIQQEQFQHRADLCRSGSSQDGDPFGDPGFSGLQQCSADLFLCPEDQLCVKWVLQTFHIPVLSEL